MRGEDLRAYLRQIGVRNRDITKHTGLSRQSLYQAFRAQKVSTELLELVAEALNTLPEKIYEEMREKNLI